MANINNKVSVKRWFWDAARFAVVKRYFSFELFSITARKKILIHILKQNTNFLVFSYI